MAKTNPITPDSQDSEDKAAKALLGVRAKATARPAPPKSRASNGNGAIGGKSVTGGARVRGGRA